jgi:PAS domain S-box-containing protein
MFFFRIVPLVFGLALLLTSDGLAVAPKEDKRVLVLYSQDKGHPAHEITDQSIREAFQSNTRFDVDIYTEYLDVGRFSHPDRASATADYLRRKYAGITVDAIITVYPQALDFLLTQRHAPFTGVPVIAAEIGRESSLRLEHSPARHFVTGVVMGDNVVLVLEDALRMRPATRRAALVAGTTPNDEYNAAIFREGLKASADRLEAIDLTKLPMKQTLERVKALPPDAILLYAGVIKDGAGQIFTPRGALSLIRRAAPVPIFSLYETFMGFGIVGGPLISFDRMGRASADLALRVMTGESPAAIPFLSDDPYTAVYDWRELKHWGILERNLPPGSTVLFKEFSLWESYRWYIIGILTFCVVESFLVVALVLNLRNRQRAERDLADSEARYRTVADYTYDWEYWSAPPGNLLYVSPSCERITGYPPRHFVEDPTRLREIIVPEDRPTWDTHDYEARKELGAREIQFRIHTRDGNVRWVEHTCRPVTDQQGQFQGVRASNRDVTERKMAELDAQKQRAELAHVTRVAAMGELTSSLAHELNQPLAAILNYANAAQRFLSGSEPDLTRVGEALAGIARDDKRASGVIRKVRDLLKKEEPHPVSLDVNSVIQGTVELIRGDPVLKGSPVAMELAPDLPAVMGDRVQLQQVLINLMLNAVAAMRTVEPGLRELVVRTERYEDEGVQVLVRDSGTGIDEADKDRLFEPFYTTKSAGMGMGLAISQRIINALGGEIRAENNPDRGATFSFTLPAASGARDGETRG